MDTAKDSDIKAKMASGVCVHTAPAAYSVVPLIMLQHMSQLVNVAFQHDMYNSALVSTVMTLRH